MDYPALRALIETHPQWPDVSDDDLVAWCNVYPPEPSRRPADVADVRRYVTEKALWRGVETLAASDSPYAPAATSALHALAPGAFGTIDLDRPQVMSLMDALVAGGAIASEDKTSILKFGDIKMFRWQLTTFNRAPTADDIGRVR